MIETFIDLTRGSNHLLWCKIKSNVSLNGANCILTSKDWSEMFEHMWLKLEKHKFVLHVICVKILEWNLRVLSPSHTSRFFVGRVLIFYQSQIPQGPPLTYFNDGGVRVIFLSLKFWPKVIFFGSMKDAGIFWGREKKNGGIFLGCEKRTKGFFWVC